MAESQREHEYEHPLLEQLALLKGDVADIENCQQALTPHDTVRFYFIESLVSRALKQRDNVRDALLKKAQQAFDEYQTSAKPLKSTPKPFVKTAIKSSPVVVALSHLQQALSGELADQKTNKPVAEKGEREGKRVEGAYAKSSALADNNTEISFTEQLARQLEEQQKQQKQPLVNGGNTPSNTQSATPLPRLKAGLAYQQFQHQQRIDHFIDSAFNETPENPGPLNPEILAIKLLKQINDLSPTYISRYVSYFETLQWLAQEIPAAPKQKGKVKEK